MFFLNILMKIKRQSGRRGTVKTQRLWIQFPLKGIYYFHFYALVDKDKINSGVKIRSWAESGDQNWLTQIPNLLYDVVAA